MSEVNENYIWIILVVVILLIVLSIVFFYYRLNRRKKNGNREKLICQSRAVNNGDNHNIFPTAIAVSDFSSDGDCGRGDNDDGGWLVGNSEVRHDSRSNDHHIGISVDNKDAHDWYSYWRQHALEHGSYLHGNRNGKADHNTSSTSANDSGGDGGYSVGLGDGGYHGDGCSGY